MTGWWPPYKVKKGISFEVDVFDSTTGPERTPYQGVRIWAIDGDKREAIFISAVGEMMPSRRMFLLEKDLK